MTRTLHSISLGELAKYLELNPETLSIVKKHADFMVTGLASLSAAKETDICFIAKSAYLDFLESSKSKLIVVREDLRVKILPSWEKDRIFISVKDPMMFMAQASAFFHKEAYEKPHIHSSATIAKSAKLGKNVHIGPYCVVDEKAELGNNTVLQSGCHVGKKVRIGDDCVFFPHVVLYDGICIGSRVRVHSNTTLGRDGFGYVQHREKSMVKHIKIHHVGSLIIGDDVEIGAGTTIDRGTLDDTRIGNRVIIDNQVQIAHNCLVEDGCIICGSTALAGNSILRAGASVGGFCRLNNGAEVGAGATLAGDSLVISKVPPGEVWRGTPAVDIKDSLRISASKVHLPEIRRLFMKWKKFYSEEEGKERGREL